MGPSCTRKSSSSSSSSSSRRRGRRTLFKNSKSHGEKSVSLASSAAKTSSKKMDDHDLSKAGNVVDMSCDNACSTPKAKRHQIPEIQTCPPAPKKRRVVKSSLSSLMRTTSISSSSSSSATGPYFAPPDIELFFYFALRGIPI